jgi:beta-galactosidase
MFGPTRSTFFVAGFVAVVLQGCGSPTTPNPAPEDLSFPQGFRFGTAIAGFQAEMGCPTIAASECQYPSDWYDYVSTPALVAETDLYLSGDPVSQGPGFYELYAQDIERAAGELHNNALRLSIEWGRIFPTATDPVSGYDNLKQLADPQALAFYHSVFAAMKQHGLKPFVTIIHYALPSWLHDAVGCHQDLDTCTNKGLVDQDRFISEATKYAGFLGQEFGGEVDDWATHNEPLTAVVIAGYLFQTPDRTQPPAVTLKTTEAKTATVTQIVSHARMYDALHAADTVDADGDGIAVRVGMVYNLESIAPADPTNPVDVTGAQNADYLLNRMVLDGVIKGELDANFDGNQVQRSDLMNRMDFLGINYYARLVVQGLSTSLFPQISPLLTFDPLTFDYDYNYAQGINDVLTFAQGYGIPLMISETGYEDPTDPDKTSEWVVQTLTWVKRAMAAGVPVEGYYYWTLMDNYEWNHGMTIKLGLYSVDPNDATKERTATPAVAVYGRIAQSSAIPMDLAAQYPAPTN